MITDVEPLTAARLRLIDSMIDRAEVVRGPVVMEWRDARSLYELAISTDKTARIEKLEGELERANDRANDHRNDYCRAERRIDELREKVRLLEAAIPGNRQLTTDN